MTYQRIAIGLIAGCVGLVAAAGAAERVSCEELLAARAGGLSEAQVEGAYQVTRARLSACERIAEHRERLQAQRNEVAAARADRAEARGQ